jgi:hypothetical protein
MARHNALARDLYSFAKEAGLRAACEQIAVELRPPEEETQEEQAEGEGMKNRAVASPNLCAVFENQKLRQAAAQIDKNPASYFDLRRDPEIGDILTSLWNFTKIPTRKSGA